MIESLYAGKTFDDSQVMNLTMNNTKQNASFNEGRSNANQTGMSKAPLGVVIEEHRAEFPTYHAIKLCMVGKAYSGKKT